MVIGTSLRCVCPATSRTEKSSTSIACAYITPRHTFRCAAPVSARAVKIGRIENATAARAWVAPGAPQDYKWQVAGVAAVLAELTQVAAGRQWAGTQQYYRTGSASISRIV